MVRPSAQRRRASNPSSKNPRWVLSKFLNEDARNHSPRNKFITPDELGEFVKEMGCKHKSNGKAWGWVFPPLAEPRQGWLATRSGIADIEDWGQIVGNRMV